MKGKVTSLMLVSGAFVVGILTRDGSLQAMAGSRVLTALAAIAWFGFMGAGLYFWAKHSRQPSPQRRSHLIQLDENSSLRQLARAIGLKKTISVTEATADSEKASSQEGTQKSLH